MNEDRDTQAADQPLSARRAFLKQAAAAGAAAGTGTTLPAAAQAQSDRSWVAYPDKPSISETFARYAASVKYEDLPANVVRTVKRTVIDTIGCAIGGYQAGPSQIAVKLASGVTAARGATVLCSGFKTSHDLAAFADGVMIRYLDFNDGHITPLGGGHPSDCLAALLPSAEIAGRSGRDLIVAMMISYEVYNKLMNVVETRRLGLDQSTILGMAALVGASRLMGLTERQLVNAIGITVGGNTAINQGRVGTLSNWKDFATAEACRKAMFSLQLAQAGMTGPDRVFEGRDGFFNVITRKPFKLPPLGSEPLGIMHAHTKRFALGQFSQTVAQAAVEIRPFFKDVSEIQEINIHVSQSAIKVMADSPDKWRPQSHETADHSMPYATAVVLTYGTIDDHYYEDPYLHDEKLLDLVSRVRCIPSEEADRREREFNLCELEVVLKNGQRKTVRVEYHRGHPKNPMTDAEMEEKFRSLASRRLSAQRSDALLRQLWALDQMPQVGAIAQMTVAERPE